MQIDLSQQSIWSHTDVHATDFSLFELCRWESVVYSKLHRGYNNKNVDLDVLILWRSVALMNANYPLTTFTKEHQNDPAPHQAVPRL